MDDSKDWDGQATGYNHDRSLSLDFQLAIVRSRVSLPICCPSRTTPAPTGRLTGSYGGLAGIFSAGSAKFANAPHDLASPLYFLRAIKKIPVTTRHYP